MVKVAIITGGLKQAMKADGRFFDVKGSLGFDRDAHLQCSSSHAGIKKRFGILRKLLYNERASAWPEPLTYFTCKGT